MTDENTQPANAEPAQTEPAETSQTEAEEQPTVVVDDATQIISPASKDASHEETGRAEIADQPTMLVPRTEAPAQASLAAGEAGEIADQPTMLVPQADLSEHETLIAPESAGEPAQPAVPAYPPTQAAGEPVQPAGQIYPPTQAAAQSAPASGPLYAGAAPTAYAPVGAYPPGYAQPGYPQGIYQQSSLQPGQLGLYAPPRKRRTVLWVVLIVLALFLFGGGTALAIVISQAPTNTPTQALQQFCDGYKTLNAQKVYDTLSTSAKAQHSKAELQQSFDEMQNLGGMVKFSDCKINSVQTNGSTSKAVITLVDTASFGSISASISMQISIGLVLENRTWKVDTMTMGKFIMPTPSIPSDFLTPTASS